MEPCGGCDVLSAWLSGGSSSSITAAPTVYGAGCSAQVSRRFADIHADSRASSALTSTGRVVQPLRQPC